MHTGQDAHRPRLRTKLCQRVYAVFCFDRVETAVRVIRTFSPSDCHKRSFVLRRFRLKFCVGCSRELLNVTMGPGLARRRLGCLAVVMVKPSRTLYWHIKQTEHSGCERNMYKLRAHPESHYVSRQKPKIFSQPRNPNPKNHRLNLNLAYVHRWPLATYCLINPDSPSFHPKR